MSRISEKLSFIDRRDVKHYETTAGFQCSLEQLKVLEYTTMNFSGRRKSTWALEKSIFPDLSGKIDTCVSVPTLYSSSCGSSRSKKN